MELLYNKDFVKSLVTVTRLIQNLVEFQFHYFVLILIIIDTFHPLLLWLQFRQGDFIILISLKFIKITVFNLNKKTLIPLWLEIQSWQVSRDILTFGIIFLVTD